MTTKNTILAIILLAIVAIIAGLGLGIVKAASLATHLGLNGVTTTSATLPGRMVGADSLAARTLVLGRGHLSLHDRALNVNTLEFSGTSASLLSV